jgi:hypothetical protein
MKAQTEIQRKVFTRGQVMKTRGMCVALFAAVLMLVGGCGGGGGGSSDGGSGTLSMSATDAKPVIPGDPTELWITFEAAYAHKSGGGWVTLPLPETPLSINLMAFSDGKTTELVPPVQLDSGHYTQLRFDVSQAYMVINGSAVPIDLGVPSGFLRIDKEFTFNVPDGQAVDLTADFDMSQSIVVTGSSQYQLKPVLHLVKTEEAATIEGTITDATFGNSSQVEVTVIWDQDGVESTSGDDEEYTKVLVTQNPPGAATDFKIFWLVPSQSYIVEGREDTNGDGIFETLVFTKYVSSAALGPGAVVDLGSL